ncbi:MFS transporter [Kitasatospora sp. NPDC059827]|uniref:MFS transporter n=1 Tax=Kitasatospora sp. NPDC059827 TaxID=3346964 RepID=UPI00365B70D0
MGVTGAGRRTNPPGPRPDPAGAGPAGLPGEPAGPRPDPRAGASLVTGLVVASLGLWTAFYTPAQVLLAGQLETIDPQRKEALLALVTGIGALVGLVATPLAGALSDRTTSRFGRRRPWVAGGALVAAAGLLLTSGRSTAAGIALGWAVVQLGLSAVLAGLMAELPDRVPVARRARVSAWTGAAQPVSLLAGTALVTSVVDGGAGRYALVALVLVVCTVVFLVLVRDDARLDRRPDRRLNRPSDRLSERSSERPSDRLSERSSDRPSPGTGLRRFLGGFRVAFAGHPDFRFAWSSRFLIQSGNAVGTLYLLYFLRDEVHYEQRFPGRSAEQGLTILVSLYSLGIVLAAFAGGAYSDRTGRRRTPVTAAGAVIAAAALLLAVWPSWPGALVAAGLMGLGYGVYVSVDQALITQVLPSADDGGRDLGITNLANVLPHLLGPLLAAALVNSPGGYRSLYAVTAGLTLGGGMLVRRVRGVR